MDTKTLKSALDARREAEDANRTAEEKLAAVEAERDELKAKAEQSIELLSKRIDDDFKALPDHAQKFVTEHAGEDPLQRQKLMGSESFKAMVGDKGKGGGAQGSLNSSPGSTGQSQVRKTYEGLKQASTDMSKTPSERAEASRQMQAYQRKHGRELFSG